MTSPWEKPAYGQPAGDPFSGTGYGTPGYGAPGYGAPGYGQPAGDPFSGTGYGAPSSTVPVTADGRWIGPPLAPWGQRAGGYLLDSLIAFVPALVAGLLVQGLDQLVNFAIFLYFGYLTGTTGQTPGRRVVGIRVVRLADGQVLGAGAGIGRAFLHVLDALPLLLGFLWPLWDKKNQTFADKIIGSVVVRV